MKKFQTIIYGTPRINLFTVEKNIKTKRNCLFCLRLNRTANNEWLKKYNYP